MDLNVKRWRCLLFVQDSIKEEDDFEALFNVRKIVTTLIDSRLREFNKNEYKEDVKP